MLCKTEVELEIPFWKMDVVDSFLWLDVAVEIKTSNGLVVDLEASCWRMDAEVGMGNSFCMMDVVEIGPSL